MPTPRSVGIAEGSISGTKSGSASSLRASGHVSGHRAELQAREEASIGWAGALLTWDSTTRPVKSREEPCPLALRPP
ncbi:hypothetical protein JCM24511_08894 [Saitozyma sp. JCM 24511]|nr:hypothetical protein JCM24511_08894 [Saitozyma sp. JCM 24511]